MFWLFVFGFIIYWISHYLLTFINSFYPLGFDPDNYGLIGVGVIFVPLFVIGAGIGIWEKFVELKVKTNGFLEKLKFKRLPSIKTFDKKTGKQFRVIKDVLIEDFGWNPNAIGPAGQEYTLDMYLGKPALKPHHLANFSGDKPFALLEELLSVGTSLRFDKSYVEPVFDQNVIFGYDTEKADKMVWTNHLRENLKLDQSLTDLFGSDLIVEGFGSSFMGVQLRTEKSKDLIDLTFYFLTLPRAVYLSKP